MQEIKDKEIFNNVDKTYFDLIRDKNNYVIEGNFDYLKNNNLLCIPIFRGDDYIANLPKNLSEFVKKRNEEKCFIMDKFWNEEKKDLIPKYLKVKIYLNRSFLIQWINSI